MINIPPYPERETPQHTQMKDNITVERSFSLDPIKSNIWLDLIRWHILLTSPKVVTH